MKRKTEREKFNEWYWRASKYRRTKGDVWLNRRDSWLAWQAAKRQAARERKR